MPTNRTHAASPPNGSASAVANVLASSSFRRSSTAYASGSALRVASSRKFSTTCDAAEPPMSARMSVSSKSSQKSSSKLGPRSSRTFICSVNFWRERERPSLIRSKNPMKMPFHANGKVNLVSLPQQKARQRASWRALFNQRSEAHLSGAARRPSSRHRPASTRRRARRTSPWCGADA